MNFIICLAFLAGIANTYATAIPAPARDIRYPNGIVLSTYPNGLPAGLYPRTEPISRAISLEKRDPQLVLDGPVQDVQAPQPVVLYACSEINFTGFCVRVTSAPGQCGEWLLQLFERGEGNYLIRKSGGRDADA